MASERPAGSKKQTVPGRGHARFSATPRPFLKWAGSKQALIPQILPYVPSTFGRYYEPFLGSGALFFFLRPERATLSDASSELIKTWIGIRDSVNEIIEYLTPLKPEKDRFYRIRSQRSDHPALRAGEFIYLNRSCWNGLYRVNSRGEFNVPFGAPKSDFLFDQDNLLACSRLLNKRGVTLRNVDFEATLASAKCGDLIFLDPPYVTKHNLNGFRDWNERLFSWSDQERLAKVAKRLADKGAHVLVSNAEHEDILKLYDGFRVSSLARTSTLASKAKRRGPVTEALFYS